MSKKISSTYKFISSVLLLVLIQSLFFFPVQAAPSSVPTGQRLRDLSGSFLIGYASKSDFWNMSDAAPYQQVARTEFNFMTPENAMKWDATEPSQNNFNFAEADQQVAFAQANNMKIHGHTLVWHSQLPSWVANGSWTSASLTAAMYNHIDKVMNHWTDGQIAAWDVVNEAFEENGTRRASVFQNVIGNSFIDLAFQRARTADPLTKLVYNDYNIETVNAKSTAVYNMVASMKSRGIPIDGVGFQMHITNSGLDYTSLAQNMQRLANLGVEIYITEMDVRLPTSNPDLQNQATIYRNVMDVCLAQPACKALQVWGIPDKYSWVPSVFPGMGAALIFDDNYNAKPAYYALQAALGSKVISTPTLTRTPITPTVTTTPLPKTFTPTNTQGVGRDGWSRIEAESYNTSTGSLQVCSGGSGSILCYIGANAWTQYNGIDLHTGTNRIDLSVANGGGNTGIQVWVGGVNLGTLTVGGTGGWSTYQTKSLTLPAQSGIKDVKLVFVNGNVNVDWLVFAGTGATNTPTRTPTNTATRTFTPTATIPVSGRDGWSTIQAESYDSSTGSLQVCSGVLCYIGPNASAQYNNVNLHSGTNRIDVSVANGGGNTGIQVWVGGVNLGTLTVTGTGGWNTYQTKSLTLPAQSGVKNVKLVFLNGNVNVDWLVFAK